MVDKSAASLKGRRHTADIYTKNGAPSVEESIKTMRRAIGPDTKAATARAGASALQSTRSEMLSYRRDPNGAIVKQFDHGTPTRALLSLDQRYEG